MNLWSSQYTVETLLSSACHFKTYSRLNHNISDAIAYWLTVPRICIHFCSAGGRQCKRQACNYAAWKCLLAGSWMTGWHTHTHTHTHTPCLYFIKRFCVWYSKTVREKRNIMFSEETTSTFLQTFNPLNPELNPICYLLALLGAHHFLHVTSIRVKSLPFRRLMSYIYGAPILDVSRSHTTTQHSR